MRYLDLQSTQNTGPCTLGVVLESSMLGTLKVQVGLSKVFVVRLHHNGSSVPKQDVAVLLLQDQIVYA